MKWEKNLGEPQDKPVAVWVSNGPMSGGYYADCELTTDDDGTPTWFSGDDYIAPDGWVSHILKIQPPTNQ